MAPAPAAEHLTGKSTLAQPSVLTDADEGRFRSAVANAINRGDDLLARVWRGPELRALGISDSEPLFAPADRFVGDHCCADGADEAERGEGRNVDCGWDKR